LSKTSLEHEEQHQEQQQQLAVAASQAFRPGLTKIFFRAGVLFALRHLKQKLLTPAAVRLQRWWWSMHSGKEVQLRRWRKAQRAVEELGLLAREHNVGDVPSVLS
jgi:myosin heavy subunit